MINVTKELSDAHTKTFKEEIWEEISEKVMEKISDMVKRNVQDALFSPFLTFSLSLLLLYYSPLFSLPTTISAPSHPLFTQSSPPPPFFPQLVTTLTLSPTHTNQSL
jgi:hypothetical protein